MKCFSLLFSLFLIQNSWANLKDCRQYVQNVLLPAVTEDTKSDGKSHSFRLPKDEKQALTIIQKIDVKKFAMKENKDARRNVLKDCNTLKNANPRELFCESSFPAFNYFRALIHGMKNSGWSASTLAQGKAQLRSYINEAAQVEPSLLEVIFATNILQMMAKEKVVAGLDEKKIDLAVNEADASSRELQMAHQQTQQMDCKIYQGLAAQEIKKTATHAQRLRALAAPLGQ